MMFLLLEQMRLINLNIQTLANKQQQSTTPIPTPILSPNATPTAIRTPTPIVIRTPTPTAIQTPNPTLYEQDDNFEPSPAPAPKTSKKRKEMTLTSPASPPSSSSLSRSPPPPPRKHQPHPIEMGPGRWWVFKENKRLLQEKKRALRLSKEAAENELHDALIDNANEYGN
jgi:hypothetical protein